MTGSPSTPPWAIGDHASVAMPWALVRRPAPRDPRRPVRLTTPDGVASPCRWVARSTSPQAAPAGRGRAPLEASTIDAPQRRTRSMTTPPSHNAVPTTLCPPPANGDRQPLGERIGERASRVVPPAQRAIRAGWRSMAPFHSRTAPRRTRRSPGRIEAPRRTPAIPPMVPIGAAWAGIHDRRATEIGTGPVRLRAREAPMARVHAIPAIRHDPRAAMLGACASTELRLLGAFGAHDRGRESTVPLAAPRAQSLLACLALHADQQPSRRHVAVPPVAGLLRGPVAQQPPPALHQIRRPGPTRTGSWPDATTSLRPHGPSARRRCVRMRAVDRGRRRHGRRRRPPPTRGARARRRPVPGRPAARLPTTTG